MEKSTILFADEFLVQMEEKRTTAGSKRKENLEEARDRIKEKLFPNGLLVSDIGGYIESKQGLESLLKGSRMYVDIEKTLSLLETVKAFEHIGIYKFPNVFAGVKQIKQAAEVIQGIYYNPYVMNKITQVYQEDETIQELTGEILRDIALTMQNYSVFFLFGQKKVLKNVILALQKAKARFPEEKIGEKALCETEIVIALLYQGVKKDTVHNHAHESLKDLEQANYKKNPHRVLTVCARYLAWGIDTPYAQKVYQQLIEEHTENPQWVGTKEDQAEKKKKANQQRIIYGILGICIKDKYKLLKNVFNPLYY